MIQNVWIVNQGMSPIKNNRIIQNSIMKESHKAILKKRRGFFKPI